MNDFFNVWSVFVLALCGISSAIREEYFVVFVTIYAFILLSDLIRYQKLSKLQYEYREKAKDYIDALHSHISFLERKLSINENESLAARYTKDIID
jgi:hypothetical protein